MSIDNWQHKSESMICKMCMWYMPKTNRIGRCRKNAPTIDGWPAVYFNDWCGDHKIINIEDKEDERQSS